MSGLLSPEQVSYIFKRLATRAVNPISLLAIQEQLILEIHFWVVSQQHLQQPIDADTITAAMLLNKAQQMRQALEDAACEKESLAKLPDKFK
jgi:DNA primase